jgi:hypothetical protein
MFSLYVHEQRRRREEEAAQRREEEALFASPAAPQPKEARLRGIYGASQGELAARARERAERRQVRLRAAQTCGAGVGEPEPEPEQGGGANQRGELCSAVALRTNLDIVPRAFFKGGGERDEARSAALARNRDRVTARRMDRRPGMLAQPAYSDPQLVFRGRERGKELAGPFLVPVALSMTDVIARLPGLPGPAGPPPAWCFTDGGRRALAPPPSAGPAKAGNVAGREFERFSRGDLLRPKTAELALFRGPFVPPAGDVLRSRDPSAERAGVFRAMFPQDQWPWDQPQQRPSTAPSSQLRAEYQQCLKQRAARGGGEAEEQGEPDGALPKCLV